eukprot:g7799.t1
MGNIGGLCSWCVWSWSPLAAKQPSADEVSVASAPAEEGGVKMGKILVRLSRNCSSGESAEVDVVPARLLSFEDEQEYAIASWSCSTDIGDEERGELDSAVLVAGGKRVVVEFVAFCAFAFADGRPGVHGSSAESAVGQKYL